MELLPFTDGESLLKHAGPLFEVGNPTKTLKALNLTGETRSRCVIHIGPDQHKTIRMAVYPSNNNPSNQRDDGGNCYQNMLSRTEARVDFGAVTDDIEPCPGDLCDLYLSIFKGKSWFYGRCEIDKVELLKDTRLVCRKILHLKKNPKKKMTDEEAQTTQAKRSRTVNLTKAPRMAFLPTE